MKTAPNRAGPVAKTLILLRHAKSSWEHDVDDHERPLSGRGKRDGIAVGQLLAARDLVPDLVACSTAARTRQTWDRAAIGGARTHKIRYLDEIYAASATELVRVIRATPEQTRTLLLVGHGPGVPDLVDFLAARRANAIWARVDHKFPTAGLAVLRFHGTWAEAGNTRAELESFDVPRRIESNGALDPQIGATGP